jgi:hypothetical protein
LFIKIETNHQQCCQNQAAVAWPNSCVGIPKAILCRLTKRA